MIVLVSTQLFGQEVEGYVYDADGRVSGVRIENLSHDRIEVSNSNGYFRIEAKIGDTIQFTSIAYELYELIVNQKQLERKTVVELKISSLDEVKVTGYKSSKTDVQNLDKNLTTQIRKDAKKHPELYQPSNGNIGNILRLIFSAFKSDKPPEKATSYLGFEDFEALFLKDKNINERFLVEELHIAEDKQELFFDFLASKQLDASFLKSENRLDLIDKLYTFAEDYKEFILSSDPRN